MLKKQLNVVIFLLLTVFMLSACGTEVAELEPIESQGSVVSDLVSDENDSDIYKEEIFETDNEADAMIEEEVQPSEDVDTPVPEEEEQVVEEIQEATHSYIANKNSKKLHYTGCESVGKMKESNKVYLDCTRSEALERGYTPCKNCNP